MRLVITALAKAVGQLLDSAVLLVLAKTVALTLLVFAGLGWALWVALDAGLESAMLPFLPDDYEGPAAAVFAVFLTAVLMWLLFRVVALAVLQLFADEIVAAVERRHYPEAARTAKALPLPRDIANSLRGAGRALFYNTLALPVAGLLVFTAIGPAVVFILVNAVLLGRELTDMPWLRHCEGDVKGNPVLRGDQVMLGGAIAGLMLVPFVSLLAPVIGAAAGTHVMHAGRADQERKEYLDA